MQEEPPSPSQINSPRQIYVECSPRWGAGRVLTVRLEKLGYKVEDERLLGAGERRLRLS
jgi:hypothetical protein